MPKTKIMCCGRDLNTLKDSGRFPCRKGVGSNAIYCNGCDHWIHKKCSLIKGRLYDDLYFRCQRCLGTAPAIDKRTLSDVQISGEKVEVVDKFCYLGDVLSPGGGCAEATINRCRIAWGRFRELLPLLTSRAISFHTRGQIYVTYVRSAMLHGSECWPVKVEDVHRLVRNERSMLRWMLNFRLQDHTSTNDIYQKLQLTTLESTLTLRRLRWFGHTERSQQWINKIREFNVAGDTRPGRPIKRWRDVVSCNIRDWSLTDTDPHDRKEWRGRLANAMEKSNPLLNGRRL